MAMTDNCRVCDETEQPMYTFGEVQDDAPMVSMVVKEADLRPWMTTGPYLYKTILRKGNEVGRVLIGLNNDDVHNPHVSAIINLGPKRQVILEDYPRGRNPEGRHN